MARAAAGGSCCPGRSTITRPLRATWRNTAVAACLRWIKVNFPEPKVQVVKEQADGKDKIVYGSEVARLLHRPNKFWSRFEFDAACSLSYVVDGNCYIRMIRSASGKVVELWWIPHWMIFPRSPMDGSVYIGWYDYEVNGRTERIPVEDIIHWRNGIDPRDDRRGFSEVKQGVRTDLRAQRVRHVHRRCSATWASSAR